LNLPARWLLLLLSHLSLLHVPRFTFHFISDFMKFLSRGAKNLKWNTPVCGAAPQAVGHSSAGTASNGDSPEINRPLLFIFSNHVSSIARGMQAQQRC
jgi:hypothetical protein